VITDTELKLMAAAAKMGLSSQPKKWIKNSGCDGHADGVVDEGEEKDSAGCCTWWPGLDCGRAGYR